MSDAYHLKSYAQDLIKTNVIKEYNDQIGKWSDAIDLMITAYIKAKNNFKQELKEIELQESSRNAIVQLIALASLSIVSGGVLGLVGTAASHALVKNKGRAPDLYNRLVSRKPRPYVYEPQYTYPKSGNVVKVTLQKRFKPYAPDTVASGSGVNTVDLYNEQARTLVAGAFTDGVKSGVSIISKQAKSKRPAAKNQADEKPDYFNKDLIEHLDDILDIHLFQKGLKSALNRHRQRGELKILRIANTLVEMNEKAVKEWGAYRLDAAGGNYDRARGIVAEHINNDRNRLAQELFYFGHDPKIDKNTEGYLIRVLETEMWVNYILTKKTTKWGTVGYGRFKRWTEKYKCRGHYDGPLRNCSRDPIVDMVAFNTKIIDRLRVLGATAPGLPKQCDASSRVRKDRPKLYEGQIDGEIDTPDEYKAMLAWAEHSRNRSKSGPMAGLGELPTRARNLIDVRHLLK